MTFHKYRTAVQQNAAPGDAGELSALERELRDALCSSGLFVSVEADHTDNPDELVIALCDYQPDLTEDEVARRIEAAWNGGVAYPFWEAHSFLIDDSHVEFLGATRPDSRGRYVTVHLVAQKARVPEQRVAA